MGTMDTMAYYNSMQAQAGLMPAPQVIFPGQVSAAIMAQGGVGAFGSIFPSQTYQTSVGAPPVFQGPTGLMAQMNPSAPYNPYAATNTASNPYASLSAYSRGQQSAFAPYAPTPPPAYGGLQGTGAVPFAPPPPRSPFDTPYGSQISQGQANVDRGWIMGEGAAGVSARLGANLGIGAMGAMAGRRFGVAGAVLGGLAGFMGSEMGGIGQGAQNLYGNMVSAPRMATYGVGNAIEHMSQGFVSNGPFMNARGSGFSHGAAHEAAEGLSSMAGSSDFRRQTQDRFNQQDVFRISQLSTEAGMMGGVSTPGAMTGRVKEIAKSLSAFMELAKEPDVVRAIQTMGSLRASGLNLQETMSAVSAGRTYARMAGTSFQTMAEMGGSMGSQTMQSMGLTQGLGFRAGMSNYGVGASSINQGIINPQMSALVGGAQGLGTLNTMFSGAMLQHPMVTPGMMGAAGGLDANAIQRMMSGESNMFSMTGRGSGVLGGMAGRYGAGGLGMAVAMQPLLQDSLGRMIQAQGTFEGRNMEDRQVMGMARQMGMRGSQGYLTAAQAMGMDRTQALTRATEMSSPSYWSTQRAQIGVEQREARGNADRAEAEDASSLGGTLYRYTGLGTAARGIRGAVHHLGVDVNRFTGGSEEHGIFDGATSDADRRELRRTYGSQSYRDFATRAASRGGTDDGLLSRMALGHRYSAASGSGEITSALGAVLRLGTDSADDRANQRRELRDASGFATDMLAATDGQKRRAVGRSDALFGGTEGLSAFTSSLSGMAGTYGGSRSVVGAGLNGLTRGIASTFSMGMADTGNLAATRGVMGSEIEARYRATMRRQGRSDEEISRLWRTERSSIAAAAGQEMEARGMTPEEREVWNRTRDAINPESGGVNEGQRAVRGAYRQLMGGAGREAQEGYRTIHGEAEGLGREGTDMNKRTRNIITTAAMANIMHTQGNKDDGARADQIREAAMRGLTPAQRAEVNARSTALSSRYRDNAGVLEAARGIFNSGSADSVVDRMGQADGALNNETAHRAAMTGFTQMSRQGGVLGNVLRGVTGRGGYDRNAVQQAFQNMTPDQIAELRREGSGGARIADMVRRGNFEGVERLAGDLGADGDRMRREWDESHSGRRRIFQTGANVLGAAVGVVAPGLGLRGRIREGARSLVDSFRESGVQDSLTPHSAAERQAMLSGRDSAAAQSEAEGQGMGRAGDALLEASRELRQAASQLSNSTLTGAIGNLVGSNSPT